jgi:23S rRNA (guanosine2251-2'-O)-methyltransferase
MKRRSVVNQGPRGRQPRRERCAYGVHAVTARLAAPEPAIEQLYLRENPSPRLSALGAEAARRGVPVTCVSIPALAELCGSEQHQGVVARVSPYRYGDLADVLARKPARILVVDQLQDPHNLGALLRTAEAAGVGLVVLPKDNSVGVTASAEKAAAGAAMRIPVAQVVNLARTLRELKDAGYWIVGLSARASADLFGFEPPAQVALVLGGEEGLRRLVEQQCDLLLKVPMEGKAESLNASVAGALAMYALRPRARNQPG